ncbi:MAG: glycerophosphodiester phosphodiesterase family protein [Acholeplasmataceae bacterium]|jgi:glycerophosphoryl diester phosphodiesterase|nr:glycerophosphodiester phosphodiesterase family protein [Acholeplasmataceae bacterium]
MKDLGWLKHELIAHRGLHSSDQAIPENSISSFQYALDKGYAIELDVNLLKDGTVVVFHDYELMRAFHDPRRIDELTYEELNRLYLFDSKEKVPTLEEVLELINGQKPVLIELKPHGNVDELCHETMKVLNHYVGKYAIFSFHPKVVHILKKDYPHVIRGQISEYFNGQKTMGKIRKYLMKSLFFNRFTKPDFISYGIKDLPNKYVDKYRNKGLTIISYAARSQEEFDFVKAHYHNVVFEYFEPKEKALD